MTQRCAVQSSLILKSSDGMDCTHSSHKVDDILECFSYKQSDWSRMLLNSLNPSSKLFDKYFTDLLTMLSVITTTPPDGSGGKSSNGVGNI